MWLFDFFNKAKDKVIDIFDWENDVPTQTSQVQQWWVNAMLWSNPTQPKQSLVWTEWKWYVRGTKDRGGLASITEAPSFFEKTKNSFTNKRWNPVQDMARPQEEVRAEKQEEFKEYWNLAWSAEQKAQILKGSVARMWFDTAKWLAWPNIRSAWNLITDPAWFIDKYLPDSLKWWIIWKYIWSSINPVWSILNASLSSSMQKTVESLINKWSNTVVDAIKEQETKFFDNRPRLDDLQSKTDQKSMLKALYEWDINTVWNKLVSVIWQNIWPVLVTLLTKSPTAWGMAFLPLESNSMLEDLNTDPATKDLDPWTKDILANMYWLISSFIEWKGMEIALSPLTIKKAITWKSWPALLSAVKQLAETMWFEWAEEVAQSNLQDAIAIIMWSDRDWSTLKENWDLFVEAWLTSFWIWLPWSIQAWVNQSQINKQNKRDEAIKKIDGKRVEEQKYQIKEWEANEKTFNYKEELEKTHQEKRQKRTDLYDEYKVKDEEISVVYDDLKALNIDKKWYWPWISTLTDVLEEWKFNEVIARNLTDFDFFDRLPKRSKDIINRQIEVFDKYNNVNKEYDKIYQDLETKRRDNSKKELTTKFIEDLKTSSKKDIVSRQMLEWMLNRWYKWPEIRIAKEILDSMEWEKVSKIEFIKKFKDKLLPLNVKESRKFADYNYLIDGNSKEYKESGRYVEAKAQTTWLLESPYETKASWSHFGNDTESYFWHVRIEEIEEDNMIRLIELQSDLMQWRRYEWDSKLHDSKFYVKETTKQLKRLDIEIDTLQKLRDNKEIAEEIIDEKHQLFNRSLEEREVSENIMIESAKELRVETYILRSLASDLLEHQKGSVHVEKTIDQLIDFVEANIEAKIIYFKKEIKNEQDNIDNASEEEITKLQQFEDYKSKRHERLVKEFIRESKSKGAESV